MKVRKEWILLWATAIAVAGSVTLAVLDVGAGRIFKLLIQADIPWVALLIFGQLLAYGGYALAYKSLFELKLKTAARQTFYGFSPFVALGGFVYDAQVLGPKMRHRVAALSAIEYLVLAPAVWAMSVFCLVGDTAVPTALSVPWAVGVPAGTAAALLVTRWRSKLHRRLAGAVNGLLAEFWGQGIINWTLILVGVAVYWTCELAVLYAGLRLFNASLGVPSLVIAYATGYVLTRRSLPSGLSAFTIILMMLVLNLLDVRLAAAFLATYCYLFINLAMPVGYLAAERGWGYRLLALGRLRRYLRS